MHKVQQGLLTIHSEDLQKVYPVWTVALARMANSFIRRHRRYVDAEDVASEVVFEFIRDLEQDPGKVRIENRQHVWWQLKIRMRHHALNRLRSEDAQIRGGGNVGGESAIGAPEEPFNAAGIGEVLDHRSDPEDWKEDSEYDETRAALVREIAQRNEPDLLPIAECLLDLMTPKEIVDQTGFSQSSVYRKIARIQEIWQKNFFDSTASG
jgi:DNA-directed RNA polymerase specialized sigma24 family protein